MRGSDPDTRSDTRAAILDSAVELFSHFGYSKTNIGDIAESVGMSSGNLYRYFRNKQAIGEAVVQDYLDADEAAMATAILDPALDCDGRLRRFVRYSIDGIIRKLREVPKMVELSDMVLRANSSVIASHVEWQRAMIAGILTDGMRDGELAEGDPLALAGAILDATKVFRSPTLLSTMDLDGVPARVDAVLDLLVAGMRAPEAKIV